jgi:hypothetical protein
VIQIRDAREKRAGSNSSGSLSVIIALALFAAVASAQPGQSSVSGPATALVETADLAVEILPALSGLPGPGAMFRITNFGPASAGPVSFTISSGAVDSIWAQVSGVSCIGNPATCAFEELLAGTSADVIVTMNNVPYGERVELVATVSAANDPNDSNDRVSGLFGNEATFACTGLGVGSRGVIRFAFAEPWPHADVPWSIGSSAPGIVAVPSTAVLRSGTSVMEVTITGLAPGLAVVTAGFGWTQKWMTIEVLPEDPGCTFSCLPPVLLTEPDGGNAICDGGSATFLARAAGTAPLSWQWYAQVLPSSISSAIPAATDSMLAVPCPATQTTIYKLRVSNACGVVESRSTTVWEGPPPPAFFYTVEPCRLVDTREGTALPAGSTRTIAAAGKCGVPSDARSLALNITVVPGTSRGFLTLYPAGGAIPESSTINYSNGRIRANNGVVGVRTDGSASLDVYHYGSQDAHLIIDVNGYFR